MTEPATTARMVTLEVDRTVCTGMRLCRLAAENVFDFDEANGVAVARPGPVGATTRVWDAVEGCPTEAIRAVDAATGEQLFP